MENRDSRILTTHVGSLVRPQGIIDLMRAKEFGQEYDREELAGKIRSGVADRKSTRLNSSHVVISYAVFCLKKKSTIN